MAYTKFSQDWLYKVLVSKKELKMLQILRQMDDTQETDGNRSPTHLTRPSYIASTGSNMHISTKDSMSFIL